MNNRQMDQVLDALANDAFLVCEELGLQAKRALACTCSALRAVIFQLIALAPALRQLPALTTLNLANNRFGDEGLAALVLPPLPVCALPTTARGLTKLQRLNLRNNQVTDAGCAILAAALDSGALPALEKHSCDIEGIPASAAAKVAVYKALADSRRVWRQRRAAAA